MKLSQMDTKNDKNLIIFSVFKILKIFSKILTDFVDWNVKKCQQGKYVLSSMLRNEIIAVFQSEIVRHRHRKR